MNPLLVLIFLFSIFMILMSVVGWIRNDHVYSYRRKVIAKIHDERVHAIVEHRAPTLDYSILDMVDYGKMNRQFWKPLGDFFPPEYRIDDLDRG